VDDDPIFGRVLSEYALREGIFLLHLTAPTALRRMEMDFDFILLDYELENITGLQLADVLSRRFKKRIPILLISSYRAIKMRNLPYGVIGFVSKSQGPVALLAAVLSAVPCTSYDEASSGSRASAPIALPFQKAGSQ